LYLTLRVRKHHAERDVYNVRHQGMEARPMAVRKLSGIVALSLGAALAAFFLTGGQVPAPSDPSTAKATPIKTPPAPGRDLSKLTPLQRQMYMSAQRGAEWLCRANRPDGRFEYGFIPCLKTNLEGDHYLRQAGAAYALARAARFTGDERHAAVARQAVLTLLVDTSENNDKSVRSTTLPSVVVNRLGAAGLLVLAINELPNPADDLLGQSEQLCQYIRGQQQADGALSYSDTPADPKAAASDPDGINQYPGVALYGLMRSQQYRPADWKTDVVRKALSYYRPWWQKNKNMGFVPWQSSACTEAYLLTKQQAFADFVFEMNDWIGGLQYTALDPKHPLWLGGFMSWTDGKTAATPPHVGSAAFAESLVAACRTARLAGDVARYPRYREALERCLQFLATLQYTDANTQHFADWYRDSLAGGFHASSQDGTLRIDYTQQAVCTLVQYLLYVAE
jgi:hypothetical protein